MDHYIGNSRDTSASPSFLTIKAMETKGNQNNALHSSLRNSSTNLSKGNVRKKEVNHQNHFHPHHLHLQKDGPDLTRRDSGSSHTSSSKSKGKRGNKSHKASRPMGKAEASANTKNNPLSAKNTPNKSKNPLKVLGIALIVDQKGIGERMLARYPTSQASVKIDEDEGQPQNSGGNDDHEDEDECNADDRSRQRDDDLFFTLTARQMAKLFRTQRSLCNQPMTLRVNKTIFCCHAVLLDENNQSNDTNGEKEKENNDASESSDKKEDSGDEGKEENSLRLFSVVVALAPTQQSALDVGSFGGGEDRSDLERYMRHGGTAKSSNLKADIQTKGSEDTLGTKTSRTTKTHDDKSLKQNQKRKRTAARVSSAFLAIRRVHISLVRFCRALEREEHRCAYVTYQSRVLFQTRNERMFQLDQMRNRNSINSIQSSASPTTNSINGSGNGDRSPYQERNSVGLVGGVHHHTPKHSRQNSFISTPGGMSSMLSDASLKNAFDIDEVGADVIGTVEQEQEKEQEILELMIACNPRDNQQGQHHPYQKRQHGNLVRDLVSVYHSLSRNDQEYPPTPNSLLCERDAVVYVNQHFAIPIDAAGLSDHSLSSSFAQGTPLSQQHKIGTVPIAEGGLPVVRPYYTLLFPHASPSELLETFHSSGSAPPQQMEHLLLTINPQKPLTQVAADANLPMHTTMQIASFLIAHGACTASPVISSRSRLTCFGSDSMQRIPELALDFSQAFPGVSLFGVVSFLTTSSRHLGDAMAILADTENEEGAWLRESLLASPVYMHHNQSFGDRDKVGSNENAFGDHQDETNDPSAYSPTILPSYVVTSRGGTKSSGMTQEPTPLSVHKWLKELEEALFSITVWLLSHKVLVQLQEYMVVVAEVSLPCLAGVNTHGDTGSASPLIAPPPFTPDSTTAQHNGSNDWDENLFNELLEMEYLNGDVSIMALSWRMAIDPRKLRRWGLRHKRVRIISRIPSPGDDWEPETRPPSSSVSPLESARASSPAFTPTVSHRAAP